MPAFALSPAPDLVPAPVVAPVVAITAANRVDGETLAEPAPCENWMLVPEPEAVFLAIARPAGRQHTNAGFEKPGLTPIPAAPMLPNHIEAPRPIWKFSVTPPERQSCGPLPAVPLPTVPLPDFIPVDYHVQRMRGEPVSRLLWQTTTFQLLAPRFVVRPVFDRLERAAPARKTARKGPAIAEIVTMPPKARKHSNRWLGLAGKAIAASLAIGAMWLGTGVVKLSRQLAASGQDGFSDGALSPGPSLSAGARGAAPAGDAASGRVGGPVAWAHKAIANRASYQAGDNFRQGMQAWGSTPKAYAPGWQRNRDGYVRPGELALFGPSLKLADYRFEFFGQVEAQSMGWVVRAKDPQNYYAMKVKVLEAGLRPVIAMVHYAVVGGKTGRSVETPLNVMVHNNRPFQVAVNVKGSRFSASIDGEEVDSWSDEALPSGGVGFFAEAGGSARLYWMKVTGNDDWLGRVCGMLTGSGSGKQVTSELWGPGPLWGPGLPDSSPGGHPRPAEPDGAGNVTLAAAGLGLPVRKARRARELSYQRYQPRYQAWNS
jgi:hypothetical protein